MDTRMTDELAELIELTATATAGCPRIVIIEGPAGSGRTRLLEDFITELRSRGHAPLREPAPGVVTRIRIAPLTPRAVELMVTRLLGRPPGPQLMHLSRVAAGNPAALEDLVAGLREERLLRIAAHRIELLSVRLPLRFRSRLAGRLAALHPPTRYLLQLAATLEPRFRLVELIQLMHSSAASLLPAIEEAFESGLLVGEEDVLSFSHELVRSMVESSIPRSVLAALRDERRRRTTITAHPAPRQLPPAPAAERTSRHPQDWSQLSSRELQIVRLVGQAMTNRQIATRIGKSPHTVNYHLRQIFRKLGIGSRVELAALAPRPDLMPAQGPGPADPSPS